MKVRQEDLPIVERWLREATEGRTIEWHNQLEEGRLNRQQFDHVLKLMQHYGSLDGQGRATPEAAGHLYANSYRREYERQLAEHEFYDAYWRPTVYGRANRWLWLAVALGSVITMARVFL